MKSNLTQNEAKRIFQEKYPDEKVIAVSDHADCYVINSHPKDLDKVRAAALIRNPFAVDKVDGRVFTFNPLLHGKNDGSENADKKRKHIEKGRRAMQSWLSNQ